jgi:hypothetical protein
VVRALSECQWRCYLEGAEVTVHTDHHPLIHIQSQSSLSRRQARWMEFLSRFEPGLKWQYKPGKNNVADGVSRNPALAQATAKASAAASTPSTTADLLPRIKRGGSSFALEPCPQTSLWPRCKHVPTFSETYLDRSGCGYVYSLFWQHLRRRCLPKPAPMRISSRRCKPTRTCHRCLTWSSQRVFRTSC